MKNFEIIETWENSQYKYYKNKVIEPYTYNFNKSYIKYLEVILIFETKEKATLWIQKNKEKKFLSLFIKQIELYNLWIKIICIFWKINLEIIKNEKKIYSLSDPFYIFWLTKYKNIWKFEMLTNF